LPLAPDLPADVDDGIALECGTVNERLCSPHPARWAEILELVNGADNQHRAVAIDGVALVTGGSRGIGAATARLLAARGFDVCVSYRLDAAAAAGVVADCEAAGRRALAVRADVSSESDVLGMFARVESELGAPGVLVNNAGIVAPARRVADMPLERIERTTSVNVLGSFLCAREAVRRMSTRHGGRGGAIVNVSSAAARLGSPGEYVDYAASKAAIDTMTLGLAREVGREGIRVNAVRPGIIDTDIHATGGRPHRARELAGQIPIGRAGTPAEVAAAIVWLCSEEASYVTGALLDVTGGR
jgi:NAD(P)-dependent dehydrogenase (short-subunit alcohol dehydrogenase family)